MSASAHRSWPTLLSDLLSGGSLTADDTAWAMEQVMGGDASDAQIAAFAIALRAKGETVDEVHGLVTTMLRHAVRIEVGDAVVDTCGTGGDRAHTVNISTMAAMVAAGAGLVVVKHGNRAATSSTGSADVLEELGVVIDLPPEQVAECVRRAGVGFCFAPVFHPALRHTATARRELGIATVFNFLGPLTNPAGPAAQVVGVAEVRMAEVMAGVLAKRDVSALVFRGDDGLDELSTGTTSRVWRVRRGTVVEEVLDPEQLGLARSDPDALRGGDRTVNAAAVRRTLAGEPGPVRDAVLLNAAAALVAAEAADDPLPDAFARALGRAAEAVDSGAAAAALDRWVATSQELRAAG